MTLRAFRAFYLLALLIGIIQLQSTQSADSEVSPNDALSLGRAKRQSQRDLEPPNKLKVDAITKTRFRVRWTLPRQRMTGTHVTIQEVDGDYFLEATTSRPRTRHVIVNELQPGTTYRISLSAVNNGRNSNVVTTTVTTKGIKKPVNPVSRVLLEAGTHGRPGHVHDPGFDVTSNSGSTTHTTTGGGSSGRMVVTLQGGSSSSSGGSTGGGSSRRVVVTSGGSTSAGGLDGFDNAGGGSSRVVITHHGESSSSSTGGGGNFTRRVVVTHGSSSSTGGGGNFTRRVVVTHGGSSSSSRGLDGGFVTSQGGSSSRVVSGGSSSSSSSSSSSGQSSSQGGGSSINGGRSRVVITSQGGSSSRVVSGGGSSSSSSSGGSSSGSSSSSSQGGRLSAGGVGPGGEFEFRPEQPRRSGTIERCKRAQKTDLVILTDGSWSVGPRNFEKMQNFLVGLIDSFTIGFDGVLVGIAQYSDNARTEFNLNDHVTQESLAEAIRNIPYLGGNTATGQALDYIREKLFTTADGARPGVSKTAIIITDGESILDSVTEPARRLREANVTVFSIGVGAALKSELIDIASKPSTSHVFSVNKFDDIEGIKDSLLRDVCQSIAVCRSLVTPENGRQACDKNMTVQGTKCEFICDQPRYKLEEGGLTVVRTCLDTGRWDNPEPFCIAALCDQLEPPPDGRYECTDNNRVGSVCTLRCSVGYRPFGSITTRCQDSARWSSRNAGCELITCPVAIAPVHGTVSCTLDNEYSSICTFTCDQGYEMQGEESSSCTATTRWSVAFPTCYIITCPALNDLEHGSVDCSDNRNYASRCEFDCTAGYQLIGSQFATCGGFGSWAFARRGVFPVCERIRCNEQELGPHLQVTCTDGLYYNSECSYSCDEGFELQGPETSRCRGRVSPGRWSEIVPVCNQITCPALQSIPNSQIVCNNGRNYGSRCSLRCNEGFQLSADSLTTCGGQGLWAGALALCIRITCDELGGIANGELTCNDGVNYGSECTYTCEVGYRLVTGSRIRRCQSDGQFDGVVAQCAITQCLTLVAPLNGRVECTRGNDFGSQCRYTCKAGYELDVEFSANGVQRRCREDLQWSHEQPKCRLISCGILVPPVDGSVRCSDHDRYGSICQFACNVGYEMSGSAERLCQDTRVWTGVLTTCRLIQCEALPALEHGSMVCTNDNNAGDEFAEEVPNAFGTSCSFSCNEGYFLSGARVSNCQADRRWSGGAIVCFRITCPFLSAPLHSVIECTQDNEYDSVCTVTCNTGYFLASGNRDRTCQGNYIWSGKEAVCQIMTCDGLVARAHSTMTCTNGNRFGSICTFKPELGYELLGEAVIVCDETGGDEPPIARRMTCQSLEAPENGVVACSDEAFFDSTCSFTCDEGYELVGSVKRDCLLSRSWSGVAVSCKLITCPVLIAPAFGSVKCSSGNLYESECSFSCDEGYDLEGSFSRSCQGSRLWTGVEVTCILITCPELAAPPNGVVECSKGWDFSSSCNFECNEGYLLSGRSTRNCRADHRWSGIDVTCILITCSVLPSPGQGRKLCTDESNFASECRFICNVGYNLVGSEQRTCQESGEWSGLRTSCGIKTCLNLKAPQNGKKTCSDGENYESNCRFSCNLGYELVGSNSRSCEESAEWSGTVTTCRQITCPELTAPSDGTVTCEGNAFTSECEFTCNVGFLMVGSSLRTCQLDKQWSGIETRCERIVCPELRVPENGKVTCLDGSNYGSDCVFQCNEGFELLGTSTRTCQLNHAWSGIEVVCQLIVCGSLPDVPNGGMTCTNNNVFASECTFACNEGFTLTGDEVRTCMQTRFWSGVQVICSMISCETLKAPRNGRKTCTNGDNYDSDCTFSCADGYEMSGTRVRTCLADNSWTGKEARCHLITCPVLPAPENGAKQCVAGSDFDSICRFTCNVGYELKASRSRRCTEDGTWTGRDTKCRLIRCGDLPAPLNGQISCTNEDAYASECTFTCANGYELVGASSRVCLDSEAWSKSQPSCQVIRCGALTAPKNGIMLCSNEDKYNSRCDYGCNVGFELVGADFSRCRLDKTWTVDPAICKAIVCDEIVIPNARVECTNGYEYNSRCVFISDEGYEFDVDDDNSFTCLANRKQDDGPQELRDSPTIMSCDVLRGPENGVIRCPTGVVFRSECTFRCDAGYQLVGSVKTTCLSVDSENRELGIDWTERVPRCSLIECEVIEAPSNGRMTCTSGFLQGSRCAIECNAGFELVGASNRICQENRDWDRPKPLCLGITCGALDEPDHGSFTCSEGDSYNSVCQFSCDQGYRLTGSITRTCLGSRTWSGALASCIVIRCGPLEGPEHGSVTCNNADFYGSECSLSCNAGFTLVGTRSRECSGLGAWSSVQAQCTLIACPRLFPPANGVVTCSNSFNFNSICRITCDDGYELVGSSTRVCGTDGNFSGAEGRCRQISCADLDEIDDGSLRCVDGFKYNSVCTYFCDRGYDLIGTPNRKCLSSGEWSNTEPICERVVCTELSAPQHGTIKCSDSNLSGSTCTASCGECFLSAGAVSRRCRANARWSGEPFACEASYCQPLHAPSNGEIECGEDDLYRCGSQCTVKCNLGFRLEGDASRTCGPDRRWEGTKARCIKSNCDVLRLDDGVTASCTKENQIGSNCSFTCAEGTLLGSKFRVCQENGRWSNSNPICKACKTAVSDVLFIIDGSWSVGEANFAKVKTFLKDLVEPFQVGWDNSRFGVIQYSDDPRVEFYMNQFFTAEDVRNGIDAIPYKGGNTHTGHALSFALLSAMTPANGARPYVNKVALILTDGRSQDEVGNPARELRQAGVKLIAVGVGNDADVNELRQIASPPYESSVFKSDDFDSIGDIQAALSAKLCESKLPPGDLCGCPAGPPGPPGPSGPAGRPGAAAKGEKGDAFSVVHVNYKDQTITARNGDGSVVDVNLPDNLRTGRDARGRNFFSMPGPPGAPGPSGTPGKDGRPGPQGAAGPPGPEGPRGDRGPRGHDGNDGIDGLNGQPGTPGKAARPAPPSGISSNEKKRMMAQLEGTARRYAEMEVRRVIERNDVVTRDTRSPPKLVVGPPGPPGPRGPQGYEGAQGVAGQQGVQGPTGKTGAKGSMGDKGARGIPGVGQRGPAGPRGRPGKKGQSKRGLPGQRGPRGPPGPPGRVVYRKRGKKIQ